MVGDRTVEERPALVLRTRLREDGPFGLMGLPGWYDVPLDSNHPEYEERAGRYEIAIDSVRGILLDAAPLAPDPHRAIDCCRPVRRRARRVTFALDCAWPAPGSRRSSHSGRPAWWPRWPF